MVVHHAHRLHEGVDGGRTEEAPAAPPELAGEPAGLGTARQSGQGPAVDPRRAARRIGLEAPEEGRERTRLLDEGAGPARVLERGGDLPPMADDTGIPEQPGDLGLPPAGQTLEIEAGEGTAEVLPLAEDDAPAEAGLEALETELLEQPAVVVHRAPPFAVVIGLVERIADAPEAAPAAVASDADAVVGCAHLPFPEKRGRPRKVARQVSDTRIREAETQRLLTRRPARKLEKRKRFEKGAPPRRHDAGDGRRLFTTPLPPARL